MEIETKQKSTAVLLLYFLLKDLRTRTVYNEGPHARRYGVVGCKKRHLCHSVCVCAQYSTAVRYCCCIVPWYESIS